jgi:hypothetical protein
MRLIKIKAVRIIFTITPCIDDITHFIVQLMHTTLKNVELLKHIKIEEAVPTCFGLQRNHHQGVLSYNYTLCLM